VKLFDADALAGLPTDTFASLLRSFDALRNRRALAAMLGCMALGALVAGLCAVLADRFGVAMSVIGFAAMFVAGSLAINAAGLLLMDQARHAATRSLPEAIVHGLVCIPKFTLLALVLGGVALAVFAVIAAVYLVCKIPLLGPVLFVVVFPLSVVLSGLTLGALCLGLFLALPALWEGASVTRALAQTLAIARHRLVEALLLLTVVALLAGVVGLIVFGVLFGGLVPALGLASAILGGGGPGVLPGILGPGAAGGAGSAYATAAGIGGGLLWALTGSLFALVYLLGLNLVYLRLTDGLDIGAAESMLNATLADAKRQAAGLGQQARSVAERARAQARQSAAAAHAALAKPRVPIDTAPAPAAAADAASETSPTVRQAPRPARVAPPDSTAPAVAATLTCPHCLSAVGKPDRFCAVCGYRLM
jgi:hypothetical protein